MLPQQACRRRVLFLSLEYVDSGQFSAAIRQSNQCIDFGRSMDMRYELKSEVLVDRGVH